MSNFGFIYPSQANKIKSPGFKSDNWRYINPNLVSKKIKQYKSIEKSVNVDNNKSGKYNIVISDDSINLNKDLSDCVSIEIYRPEEISQIKNKLNSKIGRIATNDDYLVYENTKDFKQLIFINIKRNNKDKSRIHIDFNVSKNIELKTRFFIHSECKSQSSIDINFEGSNFLNNSVFEFYLDKDSDMELFINSNDNDAISFLNYSFDMEEKSNLKATFLSLSNKIIKNDFIVNLLGRNSKVDVGGLYIGNQESITDYNININHLSDKTFSNQIFKGIMFENSKASFTGKVKIEKDCNGSKSDQENRNILMSDKARVNSDPQLEIDCNDVECSHGSTIGQFDDSVIFYLKSRGVSERDAKKMLLDAFYNDILDRFVNTEKIIAKIKEKIND